MIRKSILRRFERVEGSLLPDRWEVLKIVVNLAARVLLDWTAAERALPGVSKGARARELEASRLPIMML